MYNKNQTKVMHDTMTSLPILFPRHSRKFKTSTGLNLTPTLRPILWWDTVHFVEAFGENDQPSGGLLPALPVGIASKP